MDAFIRDALEAGAKLGTITCTASTAGEGLHEAALSALGPSLAGQLMVFSSGDTEPGKAEGSSARSGAASEESPGGLSLEAQFSRQVAQRKQDEASAFISSLKADSESSVPLGIDPQLLVAASRGREPVSAAFLAACVATIMDLPLRRCAVVAANSSLMQARCPDVGGFWEASMHARHLLPATHNVRTGRCGAAHRRRGRPAWCPSLCLRPCRRGAASCMRTPPATGLAPGAASPCAECRRCWPRPMATDPGCCLHQCMTVPVTWLIAQYLLRTTLTSEFTLQSLPSNSINSIFDSTGMPVRQ